MPSENLPNPELLDLVRNCGLGKLESLQRFFNIYSTDIYNFPIKVFQFSEDDASDFFIYAFERLKDGKRFRSFEGKSSFKTWFYSVLRNLLIDWKRTKKELKTVQVIRKNEEGQEQNFLEETPDVKSLELEKAQALSRQFQSSLDAIKIENRIVFKFSYIYYLHLSKEEVEFLKVTNKKTTQEIESFIEKLRESQSAKQLENFDSENKITSLYIQILEHGEKLSDKTISLPERERVSHLLSKKREQRRKLLEKWEKGHFLVRTPYKEVASFLGISEGDVSVILLRVIEKISKNWKEEVE